MGTLSRKRLCDLFGTTPKRERERPSGPGSDNLFGCSELLAMLINHIVLLYWVPGKWFGERGKTLHLPVQIAETQWTQWTKTRGLSCVNVFIWGPPPQTPTIPSAIVVTFANSLLFHHRLCLAAGYSKKTSEDYEKQLIQLSSIKKKICIG